MYTSPLAFTSDSFCWSLNTSFPFGLCLSPLSLRLLMIGTSMSSACIFARCGVDHSLRGGSCMPGPAESRDCTAPGGAAPLRGTKLRVSSSSSFYLFLLRAPPPFTNLLDSLCPRVPRGRGYPQTAERGAWADPLPLMSMCQWEGKWLTVISRALRKVLKSFELFLVYIFYVDSTTTSLSAYVSTNFGNLEEKKIRFDHSCL